MCVCNVVKACVANYITLDLMSEKEIEDCTNYSNISKIAKIVFILLNGNNILHFSVILLCFIIFYKKIRHRFRKIDLNISSQYSSS